MKKTFKKITASIMAVATLAVGVAGMSVSAGQAVGRYGTITSSTISAETKNNSMTPRKLIASVTVYRDGSDAYITTVSDSKTGGYGTTACASVSLTTYPRRLYHFKLYGAIYNSASDVSGVLESWSEYVD